MWKKNKKTETRFIPEPVVLNVPSKDDADVKFSNISEDGFWLFDIANYLPENMRKFTADSAASTAYYIGCWDFQLRSSTSLSLAYWAGGADGPVFGLMYDVLYNNSKVGALEIKPVFYSAEFDEGHHKANTRDLGLYVEIDNAASIQYKHIRGLLNCIYDSFASESVEGLNQYSTNARFVTESLQKVIWNNQVEGFSETTLEYYNCVTVSKDRMVAIADS